MIYIENEQMSESISSAMQLLSVPLGLHAKAEKEPENAQQIVGTRQTGVWHFKSLFASAPILSNIHSNIIQLKYKEQHNVFALIFMAGETWCQYAQKCCFWLFETEKDNRMWNISLFKVPIFSFQVKRGQVLESPC